MFVRGALSAIDHNANIDREQKKTASGQLVFDLIKKRHGKKYIIKVVKESKEYSWRDILASWTIECVRTGTRPQVEIPLGEEMDSHAAEIVKPDKASAILHHQSRFGS